MRNSFVILILRRAALMAILLTAGYSSGHATGQTAAWERELDHLRAKKAQVTARIKTLEAEILRELAKRPKSVIDRFLEELAQRATIDPPDDPVLRRVLQLTREVWVLQDELAAVDYRIKGIVHEMRAAEEQLKRSRKVIEVDQSNTGTVRRAFRYSHALQEVGGSSALDRRAFTGTVIEKAILSRQVAITTGVGAVFKRHQHLTTSYDIYCMMLLKGVLGSGA